MKALKITIIALLAGFSMASCDFLDKEPTKLTPENYFNTPAEANSFLTGVYAILSQPTFYGGDYMYLVAGDDLSHYGGSGRGPASTGLICNNATTSDNAVTAFWYALYSGINRANMFLENIDKVNGFDAGVKEQYIAEARFLRAFYYFNLVECWGDVPFKTVSTQSVTNLNIPRTDKQEIYDFIISEMADAAETGLKSASDLAYKPGRISQSTAWGILARVYLYKGDKTKALEYAKEVIDSKKFSLLEESQLVKDKTWGYLCSENEYLSSLYVYDMEEGRSDVYFGEGSSAVCHISDTRRASVFGTPGVDIDWRNQNMFFLKTGEAKTYIGKYRGVNRIPLLKLSEMYLIAAEASGDKSYLQTLRDHRGYVNYPLEENCDLAAEIEAEYRKEFMAEGQLFYYYKRLDYITLPDMGVVMTGNYVFPMPDDEMEFGDIK